MISVIIPCYNQGEYLDEAITSVINQTELPNELIIVNDGSTDNSSEIARKYQGIVERKGQKLKIIVINQVNKGLASARNTGVMNSNNPIILPLDADDKLFPDCIRRINDAYWSDTWDILGLSARTFGTSDETIILMPDPKLEDFRTGNRLGYFSAIKKHKLLEVGGYSPRMTEGYEDLALWCDLLNRGAKVKTLQEPLVWYRTKDKSMWKDITPEIHTKLLAQINKDVPEAKLSF